MVLGVRIRRRPQLRDRGHLLARVAQCPDKRRIRQGDVPVRVAHGHRHRGEFDHASEALLAVAKLIAGRLEVGKIPPDLHEQQRRRHDEEHALGDRDERQQIRVDSHGPGEAV